MVMRVVERDELDRASAARPVRMRRAQRSRGATITCSLRDEAGGRPAALLPRFERLQIPAVRARPALVSEHVLERSLAVDQRILVVEGLHPLGAVNVDEAELVGAAVAAPRLVA